MIRARRSLSTVCFLLFWLGMAGLAATAHAQGMPGSYPVQVVDQVWRDESRGRDIPVRLRIPQSRNAGERFPVIIYSHGLGGDRDSGAAWTEHWAANGYFVVQIQHPGSDAIFVDSLPGDWAAVKQVRNFAIPNLVPARAFDVRYVLDELRQRPESRLIDLGRVGLAGHSLGAYTVQILAGQRASARLPVLADTRIRAVIALSPAVRNRVDAETQFSEVRIPFMSITGSRDQDRQGLADAPEERTRPFYAMPPGGKYLLVLHGADNAVFGGNPGMSNQPREPGAAAFDGHVAHVVQLFSLAFWDAYLRDIPQAEQWLKGRNNRRELADDDRYERR
ncbi:alpha/beta hydrolase family protein [Derxia gummosa]|uniref:Alpha/beta hydrolase family protein n=1 Tax=Derxia gummosa DSM 723 TaxID=1121388 RepID=A0A8B6XAK6_9BURK|nr:alpha/beta hydrolase-fold protein [Derxia gummosa]